MTNDSVKPALYMDHRGNVVRKGDLVVHRTLGFLSFMLPVFGYAAELVEKDGRKRLMITAREMGTTTTLHRWVNPAKYRLMDSPVPRRLRGVLVVNRGTPYEAVVLAVEAHPWHRHEPDAVVCDEAGCKPCHSVFTLGNMVFDFENRRVHPVGSPNWPNREVSRLGQIPREDLKKFKADFGLYYSS